MERRVRDDELLDDVPPATRSDEPRENGYRGTLPPPLPPPPRFSYSARDGRSSNRPGELVHVGPAYSSPELVTLPPPVLVDRSSLLGLAAIVVFGQVIGTAAAVYIANSGGSTRAPGPESHQRVTLDSLVAAPEHAARPRERALESPSEAPVAAPVVQPAQPAQPAQPSPPAPLAQSAPGTEAAKPPAGRAVKRAQPRPKPTPVEAAEPAPAPAVARAGLFDTVY